MTLPALIQSIGYLGVFAIVFAENGLLIGFFLPGDSLLFTAGILSAQGFFNIWLMLIFMTVASIVGTYTGYIFGRRWGRRLFNRTNSRFFKQENLIKAEEFYEHYGAKTIILARFVPIIRTFAPIVAGIGNMSFFKFMVYNIIGGVLWVGSVAGLGYWLGERVENIDRWLIPVIAIIILLSVAPGIYHMLRDPARRQSSWQWVRNLFRK